MSAHLAVVVAVAFLGLGSITASSGEDVVVRRVPNGGLKASAAVDGAGTIHLVYFSGDPRGGDAMYVTSHDGGATFSEPLRVNSQPGSAMGFSSARGPHLAPGRDGRMHVIWMGSPKATPRAPLNPAMPANNPNNGTPLLYARLEPKASKFTEQRNLMTKTVGLDGDSALAATPDGNVYVTWHGQTPEGKSEKDRGVWLARSTDDGATFSAERNVLTEATGVCPCCGLTAQADAKGSLAILYRAATESIHRGMRLLVSNDRGETFANTPLDEWKVGSCPMSTATLISTRSGFIGAWENNRRLALSRFPALPPAEFSGNESRKHPSLAMNSKGESLLAWVEGIAFAKGGSVAWQRFDADGKPLGGPGHSDNLPAHGNVAAVALADGTFAVIY